MVDEAGETVIEERDGRAGATVDAPPGAAASAGDASGRAAALEAELRVLDEAHRRLMADFANYRRRVERDRADWEAAARGDLLLRVLPAVDNLRRAREAAARGGQATDAQAALGAVVTGLDMVVRAFDEALTGVGVEESVAVGDAFDPQTAEAIGQDERDDLEPGQVSEVLQAGYRLAGRVLRPALVRVAVAPASPPEEGERG